MVGGDGREGFSGLVAGREGFCSVGLMRSDLGFVFGGGCVARAGIGEVERKVQKSYWEEHSKCLTVESMMLDSRAADLDKEERPEVPHQHPPLRLPSFLFPLLLLLNDLLFFGGAYVLSIPESCHISDAEK